jgi:hypothetical protein
MRAAASRLRTLVLNADYRPISVTSAMRGIRLLETNKAMPIEMRPQLLLSEARAWACPSVIVLTQYVKARARPAAAQLRPSRVRVMERDGHTCQYCGAPARTVDHIVPTSKGGTNTWENMVAACEVRARRARARRQKRAREPADPRPCPRRRATRRRAASRSAARGCGSRDSPLGRNTCHP